MVVRGDAERGGGERGKKNGNLKCDFLGDKY